MLRLTLVGENGAGKTTLTKLLGRLYDPSDGRILLEGRDLREYDLGSIRHAVGVLTTGTRIHLIGFAPDADLSERYSHLTNHAEGKRARFIGSIQKRR